MSLQLYSASAGSGKTYTLTVEYIKLALQAYESRGYFRRILAVTFTTKAAEEMRSRIIEFLSGIAAVETLSNEEEATYRGIISNIQRDYQFANIIMSDEAQMNTKPELEIYADDVKCSHGTTTGQFDEEALFYLRARGFSLESAKMLLISAFTSDVISRISNEQHRAFVLHELKKRDLITE